MGPKIVQLFFGIKRKSNGTKRRAQKIKNVNDLPEQAI